MENLNCWEFKRCGREAHGIRAHEMGVCPAAKLEVANGFLGGVNGGRACAFITGTFCSNTIEGTHREKEKQCDKCGFYQILMKQHGEDVSVQSFLLYVLHN